MVPLVGGQLTIDQIHLAIRFFLSQPTDLLRLFISKKKALINFLTIEFQHRFLKSAYVSGYPYRLIIETGNVCPLRCVLCPTGRRENGLPTGFLSFLDFKKIVDELGDYLIIIDLYNWGEPLLNTEIFEIVRYARDKNILVILSSNLNHFDKAICKKLIRCDLNLLMISLYGASQETVETYQRGNNFENVIENVRRVVEEKRKSKRKKPFLQWRFMVTRYNEHEIPKAIEIAKKIGIDFLELGCFRCDMSKEVFLDNASQFESVREWLPKNERYSMYDYIHKRKKILRKNDCSFLWTQSVVNWDGSVFPCCAVYGERWNFGNMFRSNFREIWNNAKYRASREMIARGKGTGTKTICDICKKNNAQI